MDIQVELEFDMSTQQVADTINVSAPHVITLARSDVLPHRMVTGVYHFRRDDVQIYAAVQRHNRDQLLSSIAPESGYTAEDF